LKRIGIVVKADAKAGKKADELENWPVQKGNHLLYQVIL